ncbi:hypothetical protein PIROE2DRAFT_4890 [Piromyces sp. E2]|nr:hypothetical protein PIROE2DRAFT_4890 [Piromyces sp. E2]|eukprot:OUM67603.1 hypothetical protein PIROE2DRAFT_4890 [Piromyces sp. E2]
MDNTVMPTNVAADIPEFKTFEDKSISEKGIIIGDWKISTRKDRILNSEEIDKYLLFS